MPMSRSLLGLAVAALLVTGCVVHEVGNDTVERNLEGPPLELAPGEGARFEIGVIASSVHAENTYGSILRVTAELERADDASAVMFEVAGLGGRTWADLSVPD